MRKDLENLTRQLCEKYEALRSVAILVDDVSTPLSPHPGYVWGDMLGGDPNNEDLESLQGMVAVAARFYTMAAETYARACRDKINERVIYLESLRKKVAADIQRSDAIGAEITEHEERVERLKKQLDALESKAAGDPPQEDGGGDRKEAGDQQAGADQVPG